MAFLSFPCPQQQYEASTCRKRCRLDSPCRLLRSESSFSPTLMALYYSRYFSLRERAAAQRGARLRRWLHAVPPFVRRFSGGEGGEAGAVVVPAGAGLVARRQSDQR